MPWLCAPGVRWSLADGTVHREDEPAWQYFYDDTWLTLQRGMAELELARYASDAGPRAVDLLSTGLALLPNGYRRDRAWYSTCLARALYVAGDLVAAATTGVETVDDALALNRYAVDDLRVLQRELSSVIPEAESVVALGDRFRNATASSA